MFDVLPPALIMLAGAVLIGLTRGHWRNLFVLGRRCMTLWAIWQIPDGVVATVTFLGYLIEPIEGSPVRSLFATIFAVMAFGGGLYAFRQAKWYELSAAYIYAAGAIGVSFAGDLITFFLYWELMALFSTVVVWCGGTPGARAAGIRYAIMHLLGGVILKVGIEGVMVHTGSIDVQPMLASNFDTWMILIGILINAAAPPVSAWLADAYPESSPTGSVFLSAFTTKTAVLALILLFPGEPVLVGVGLFMVMYGIIYALLENDVRRILAYSIVNQVGFMVCAVGIGTQMAINGAAAHAFAHILYKALLFMSAGAVIYRTGFSKCTDLGGLFRTMPLTAICGIIGALAISGFPLTSGFTTKTMISQAAADESLVFVYFMLAAASAGVFLHAGIKFPWFVFFQKGLRAAPQRRSLEHGSGHGAAERTLHPARRIPEPPVRVSALPRGLRALHGRQGSVLLTAAAVLGARVLPATAAHEAYMHREPGYRLGVARAAVPCCRCPARRRCSAGRRAALAYRSPSQCFAQPGRGLFQHPAHRARGRVCTCLVHRHNGTLDRYTADSLRVRVCDLAPSMPRKVRIFRS